MTDSAANDQDLVKALDSIAAATPVTPGVGAIAQTPFGPLPAPAVSTPATPVVDIASPSVTPPAAEPVASNSPLDAIKKDALLELRPLVDKLSVSPEEKFDTYLLLIRSTDDSNLIAPAHEAAKAISDETRRAEALLDIIKEIDYLSRPKEA